VAQRRHLYILMDITNRCNLRCAMCTRAVSTPGTRQDMTVEQFRAIGDRCFDHATVLALSCGAEPLMARHLPEILTTLAGYRVPSTEMVTNGQLLDEAKIEALIDTHFSRLVVSIDGATASTYEDIRRGAKFDRLLANLALLQRLKRKRRVSHPRVRFNFVMMRSNVEELPALTELAAELGATQVTAQHAVIYEGCLPEQESLFYHQELANRALIEARRTAAKSGILLNAPPLFDSAVPSLAQKRWLWASHLVNAASALREFGIPRMRVLVANTMRHQVFHREIRCRHPWEVIVLDLDGNARPCMNWKSESPLGNCSHQTYDEIWVGAGFARLRDELTGRAPLRHTCRHCPALFSGRVDDDAAFEKVSL
jgi:MoaA/NifB/PqqE/SkfB family radical SAM enzyme